MKDKVSVIIPSYNYSWCIDEAIESAINQDYENWELIIVDDGSKDNSAEIINRYIKKYPKKIKLLFHPNKINMGLSESYKLGIKHSTGEYICFLEADDIIKKDFISSKIRIFKNEKVTVIFNNLEVFGSEDIIAKQKKDIIFSQHKIPKETPFNASGFLIKNNVVFTFSCFMVKKEILKEVDFNSPVDEWLDWWIFYQLSLKGKFYFQQDKKTKWRRHKESYDYLHYKNNNVEGKREIMQKKMKALTPQSSGKKRTKLICFYLPQFHRIPENDRWWGKGFTEWTNVKKTKPHFDEHYQPKMPGELGYYNLTDEKIAIKQAKLAKEYGIDGFCYYYYWFNGKKLLEKPIERLLETKKPNFPFCICWANENWTRRWDGFNNEVLIKQEYSDEKNIELINELIPYFKDKRYIRIDSKPLFIVYKTKDFPNLKETVQLWREECRKKGIEEIHVSMVQTFGQDNFEQYGLDSAIQFFPHNLSEKIINSTINNKGKLRNLNPEFNGKVLDYKEIMEDFISKSTNQFSGVIPGWDNSARRKNDPMIVINSSPEEYRKWLETAIKRSREKNSELVFINAWNEWAEGCYLEPDKRFGRSFLEATRKAVKNTK
jgi:glycosyltransferase involved in cell wall biosynthesis